jgi:hypothetical protein
MILLLAKCCNASLVSRKGETPLTKLIKKCKDKNLSTKIVERFVKKAKIKFSDAILDQMVEMGLKISIEEKIWHIENCFDVDFMIDLRKNCNEDEFEHHLITFKKQTENFLDDFSIFVEISIIMNLNKTLKILGSNGADVNHCSKLSTIKKKFNS